MRLEDVADRPDPIDEGRFGDQSRAVTLSGSGFALKEGRSIDEVMQTLAFAKALSWAWS
jgi:hypothetical protein